MFNKCTNCIRFYTLLGVKTDMSIIWIEHMSSLWCNKAKGSFIKGNCFLSQIKQVSKTLLFTVNHIRL